MNFEKLEQIKEEYRKLGRQTDNLLEILYETIPRSHYKYIEDQLYLRLEVVKETIVAYTKELDAIHRKRAY